MKTIFIKFINSGVRLSNTYAFNTEEDVAVGDTIVDLIGNLATYMEVVAVLDRSYKYVNTATGDIMDEINSTKCVKIKTLKLIDEEADVIYGIKKAKD